MTGHYKGLINRYRSRLPVSAETPVITLNEGNTPLIEFVNLPKLLGRNVRILGKFEGLNPTGSFKDRGMTMAVSKAVESGSKAIICEDGLHERRKIGVLAFLAMHIMPIRKKAFRCWRKRKHHIVR